MRYAIWAPGQCQHQPDRQPRQAAVSTIRKIRRAMMLSLDRKSPLSTLLAQGQGDIGGRNAARPPAGIWGIPVGVVEKPSRGYDPDVGNKPRAGALLLWRSLGTGPEQPG